MSNDVNIIDMKRVDALNAALELLHFGFRGIVLEPDAILAKKKMGRAHHRILFMLAHHGEQSTSALTEILGISRQALNRPLSELIDQGYVVSRTSPEYWRSTLHALTSKGIALEERLSGMQRRQIDAAFSAAGPGAERHWRAVMVALSASIRPNPRGRA